MAHSHGHSHAPGHNRTFSVVSLNSSVDGVPIKVSDKVLPFPKVSLPLDYETGNPTEVLFLEYDFKKENEVMQYVNAQKLAKEAALAEAEQLRIARQEAARREEEEASQVEAGTINGDSQEFSNEDAPSSSSSPDEAPHQNNQATATVQQGNSIGGIQVNKSQFSKPFLNLGSILTPTPFSHKPDDKSVAVNPDPFPSPLNIQDFESVQDPFDSLELKTLDDKAELNQMLQNSQAVTKVISNSSQSTAGQAIASNDKNGIQHNHTSQGVDLNHDEQLASFSNMRSQTVSQITSDFNHVPTYTDIKNVDYPDIDALQLKSTSMSQTSISSYNTQSTITTPACSSFSNGAYPSQVPGQANLYNPWNNLSSMTEYSMNNGLNVQNSSSHTMSSAAPNTGSMRSARSTPDIASLNDTSAKPMPTSHTPPPYAGRTISPTPTEKVPRRPSPPPRPSSQQAPLDQDNTPMTWNKYKVLPPAPNPKPALDKPAPKPPMPVPTLPDPYQTLSPEEQVLTESIADMGFSRARVSRMVKLLGKDHKKIVDYLCLVTRLEEKGFKGYDAETALNLFINKPDKAAVYLQMLTQLEQLGFGRDKISEALVATDLDEDKTLDMLTSR